MTTDPHLGEHGSEYHPAWVTIGASRTSSTPGVNLFDSDVIHQHTVRIQLKTATRTRSLHNDLIYGTKTLYEVELSEAQWASFVSAMNVGDGVPATLRWDGGPVDDFPHAPRLAETIAETHAAADRAFEAIQTAFRKVEAATTAKEKREAMSTLRATINNATPNVDFAGKQLVQQAEDVVQKAKADVEAFVTSRARQLGLDSSDVLALPEGTI